MKKPAIHDLVKILSRETGLSSPEILDILRTPLHPRDLRDEFAAQALAGGLASAEYDMHTHEWANWAYKLADAMLKAREVQS